MFVPWLLQELLDGNTLLYVSWVTAIIVGVVLHELAHGWAALRQGDMTPRWTGHMTPNPMVHMGFISLALAFTMGLAWGAMPIDPSRFKSKYGEAIVAIAGPLMNVVLALGALIGLGLWYRFGGIADQGPAGNWQQFLWLFGNCQLVLAVFNLAPIPPLDGSAILANFHQGYRHWVRSLQNPWIMFMVYFAILAAMNRTDYNIWSAGAWLAELIVSAVAGWA